MNGSTAPSRQARISPSRIPSQAQVRGAPSTTSGNWPLMSWRSRRVEPDLVAVAVELGPDPVVLVLDPDRDAEPLDDLGGVLGRRGEHELERVEERELGLVEPVVAGERRPSARCRRSASRPTSPRRAAGRTPSRSPPRRGPRGARSGARRDRTLTMYFAVSGSDRARRSREDRRPSRAGPGRGLDRGEGGGDLGERRRRPPGPARGRRAVRTSATAMPRSDERS